MFNETQLGNEFRTFHFVKTICGVPFWSSSDRDICATVGIFTDRAKVLSETRRWYGD